MQTNGDDGDEAVWWAARLDATDRLTADEQTALETWLSGAPARAGALLRAEAALAYLDRGRALARDTMPIATRRRVLSWSLAGIATAAMSAVGLVMLMPARQRFATGLGEVRRIPLSDGSVAALNTGSTLSVTMEAQHRNVALLDGEAWFEVAHDQKRPFVVEIDDLRVKAVGTAFSVRRRETGADVLVTEGTVEAWREGSPEQPTRITAGERGFINFAASPTPSTPPRPVAAPQEIDRALAWRVGELSLDGDTLETAVEEMNRYNRVQIEVTPSLGRERLLGVFRTNDPAGFAESAARIVGGQAVVGPDRIFIQPADRKPPRD